MILRFDIKHVDPKRSQEMIMFVIMFNHDESIFNSFKTKLTFLHICSCHYWNQYIHSCSRIHLAISVLVCMTSLCKYIHLKGQETVYDEPL